jgi:hypothetical protein
MNNIEALLEQYFEGLTSVEEEVTLRRFFTSGDVPENLMMYKPLFAYFDNEVKRPVTTYKSQNGVRSLVLWLSGVAACAALMIGVFLTNQQSKNCPGEGDYVIIDGRCYTDAKTIRSATLNTLREISYDDDEVIENQLKEFDSLFNK